MDDFGKKEQLVDGYIQENNVEAAVKLLFDLILAAAKGHDFIKAEALREKLLEVDPLALTEITKSGDIIEEEKSKLLDQNHLSAWSKLYDILTTEETHALFFSTKPAEYKTDDTVYGQGEKNINLYLIDRGHLKMVYRTNIREILVKKLGPGDFSGDDTFFSTTAANSVSLIAGSDVKLRILPNTVLKDWGTHYPGLNSKLLDHCLKAGLVHDTIKNMNINRRTQKRIEISGIGVFQFLKKSGETLGDPFKGNLVDISVGGMSFLMRISKRETARLLLGRKINMKFQVKTGQDPLKIRQAGTIIGLREDAFQDYSIHTKFDILLDQNIIEKIKSGVKQ